MPTNQINKTKINKNRQSRWKVLRIYKRLNMKINNSNIYQSTVLQKKLDQSLSDTKKDCIGKFGLVTDTNLSLLVNIKFQYLQRPAH